jgi:hypothetical protein
LVSVEGLRPSTTSLFYYFTPPSYYSRVRGRGIGYIREASPFLDSLYLISQSKQRVSIDFEGELVI